MIRVLRLEGAGTLMTAAVFDDALAQNLAPALSVERADAAAFLDGVFGRAEVRPDDEAVHRAFRAATRGFAFFCPNYKVIPLAPLLLYVRNRGRAPIRLLFIAHAPGVYPLEWALLRPLLRRGDVIVAPTKSARDAIESLCPELAPYLRVIPHPIRPPPCRPAAQRADIVSLTRMHPSKLLHRQIEAMAVLRERGVSGVRLRVAGPTREPGAEGTSPYARSLAAKIARLRLDDRVELIGCIEGARAKGDLLAGARLLLNLSVTIEESFGKAIVEALGCGVPVLATRWNGLPETIGAAGACVDVDATPFGMDVPAERIADAIEALLGVDQRPEACRREALRSHPRRVRGLYREALQGALAAAEATGGDDAPPHPSTPAAPPGGLLGVTAPLLRFSWSELFHHHLRDAVRQRQALAGAVHPDASAADELRALLILGVQGPLGRMYAGHGAHADVRPATAENARCGDEGDLFARIGAAATSGATTSSRLACLAVMVGAGRVEPLRLGLQALRRDGVRSLGLRHFEVEALRLERQYPQAFKASVEDEDPILWGDLAAHRLRLLAAVCREWGLPGLALPWLREWLARFPDAPDSAMVWIDRGANAAALPGLEQEAHDALERGRALLGASADVDRLESWMRRAEAGRG